MLEDLIDLLTHLLLFGRLNFGQLLDTVNANASTEDLDLKQRKEGKEAEK